MDHILLALHLPSLVILDMSWILNIEEDLESQLTAYLMDFGAIILQNANLVPKLR